MKKILAGAFVEPQNEKVINNALIIKNGENYEIKKFNPYPSRNDLENIIDLSHLYVLPALIDSHVHLSLNGKDFKESLKQWEDQSSLKKGIQKHLDALNNTGIGALREGGDKVHSGIIAKNFAGSCHIAACGEGIRREGYYGSFLGQGLKNPKEEIRNKLKELKEKGIDQVKIILSGIVSFNKYGKVGALQFNSKEIEMIKELSQELNLPLMTHVNSEEGIRLAVSAGVHSIEHGYFMREKLLKEMAAKNIYWVPTVAAVANQVHKRQDDYSKEQREIITKTYKNQLLMLKKAEETGVKIGLGTDAGAVGVEHGRDYFREIELFLEAGLKNETILKAATSWNREILKIKQEKNLGFLGVKENPLENIKTLSEPQIVI